MSDISSSSKCIGCESVSPAQKYQRSDRQDRARARFGNRNNVADRSVTDAPAISRANFVSPRHIQSARTLQQRIAAVRWRQHRIISARGWPRRRRQIGRHDLKIISPLRHKRDRRPRFVRQIMRQQQCFRFLFLRIITIRHRIDGQCPCSPQQVSAGNSRSVIARERLPKDDG